MPEEEVLIANAHYEVWSPFDAAGMAETLMQMFADVCNSQIPTKIPQFTVSQS